MEKSNELFGLRNISEKRDISSQKASAGPSGGAPEKASLSQEMAAPCILFPLKIPQWEKM